MEKIYKSIDMRKLRIFWECEQFGLFKTGGFCTEVFVNGTSWW
jgi:hypothetical protein